MQKKNCLLLFCPMVVGVPLSAHLHNTERSSIFRVNDSIITHNVEGEGGQQRTRENGLQHASATAIRSSVVRLYKGVTRRSCPTFSPFIVNHIYTAWHDRRQTKCKANDLIIVHDVSYATNTTAYNPKNLFWFLGPKHTLSSRQRQRRRWLGDSHVARTF